LTKWQGFFIFIAIVLLAACLRLYRLDQLPPGLHYDEAFKGVAARGVITGAARPIFFTENLTEEPMMAYATALAFVLFGETPWAIRLVSALAGILTVAALYMLARALFRSRASAALAALVLAILYWHVNFSRLGMEPILTPFTLTLAFAFLWRGLHLTSLPQPPLPSPDEVRQERGEGAMGVRGEVDFALAGLFLAGTQYTYKAALFIPLLVAAFIGIEILVDRGFWMRNWRGLLICALVAVLVFAPLGLYFVTHPGEFLERPSTVAASGAATLADNALKVAGMFFWRGDDNPRSNLPGRPALDPFLAIGFIVGLVACVARICKPESRFLLLWLIVMTLPSVLTDFAPHFGRSIGATPVLALITAYGFGTVGQVASAAWRAPRRDPSHVTRHPSLAARVTFAAILIAGLAFSASSTFNDYFNIWGARAGLFDSFDVGYLALAQKLRAAPANETLYLSPVAREYYTIQFGLAGRAARSFDGRRVLVLPPPGAPAAFGVVVRDDPRTPARLARLFPTSRAIETIDDWTGKAYAAIYRVEGAPRLAPQHSVHARLGDAIELIGYDVAREADAIALTVYWGSLAETRADYTVFVHLIGDALNPATQSPVWAQDDTRPGRGSYPTARWQAGEIIVDEYRVTIPADAPRGEYQIEMGMYNLETGARVRRVDANGAPMENDRVVFERITLP
jgi:hypothetical protein